GPAPQSASGPRLAPEAQLDWFSISRDEFQSTDLCDSASELHAKVNDFAGLVDGRVQSIPLS
ncbi:hypothetical protein, partial [Stieleria varia]|uniref:hypothetical protein n=1 Tax=Stieleria varia TaxID=2528005 RepID=UPI001E5CE72E